MFGLWHGQNLPRSASYRVVVASTGRAFIMRLRGAGRNENGSDGTTGHAKTVT